MGCVLVNIIVKPKNSVIEHIRAKTSFYNIDTGDVHDNSQNNLYKTNRADWIEELDDEYVLFHNDVMMVEYLNDLSDTVGKNDIGTTEYINDDECHGELMEGYSEIWKHVCHLFTKELTLGEEEEISKRFIINVVMNYYHDSYVGDDDMNMYVSEIWQLPSNGVMESLKALNLSRDDPRYQIPSEFR